MIKNIFNAINAFKAFKEETDYIDDEIKALYKKHGSKMKTIIKHSEQAILSSAENPKANLNMSSKEAKPNARKLLNNLESSGYDCENIVYMKYLCGFMFASSSLKEIAKIIAEDIGMKQLH